MTNFNFNDLSCSSTASADEGDGEGAKANAATPMMVYPNPATKQVRIRGASGYRAEVLDLRGQVVLPEVRLSEKATLNVDSLRPGLYVLRVKNAQGSSQYQQRLLVE